MCCEVARRQLAADTAAPGTGDGVGDKAGTGGGWREPRQLRSLCLLSGAGVHWTLGKWGMGKDGVRLPLHRAPPAMGLAANFAHSAVRLLLVLVLVLVLVVVVVLLLVSVVVVVEVIAQQD